MIKLNKSYGPSTGRAVHITATVSPALKIPQRERRVMSPTLLSTINLLAV